MKTPIGTMEKDNFAINLAGNIMAATIGTIIVNVVYELLHEKTGISMEDLREEGEGIIDQIKAENMGLV